MGRRVITFDDITGEEGAEKRLLGIGDEVVEIDLTDEGFEEAKAALGPWLRVGTVAGRLAVDTKGRRPPRQMIESAIRHSPEEVAELRVWATKYGVRGLRESGRIAADIWEAFRKKDLSLLTKDHQPPTYAAETPEPEEAPEAVAAPPRRRGRALAAQPELEMANA